MRFAGRILLAGALAAIVLTVPPQAAAQSVKSTKPAAAKPAAPKPTTQELLRLLAEQRQLIEQQRQLLADQQATIEGQQTTIEEQSAAIAAQSQRLADLEAQLGAVNKRLDEVLGQLPDQAAIEERLKHVEELSTKVPELPPEMVSAGDFPGSIRIPGTNTAFKFGGRIRTAAVFTLDSLGSDDRFVTNSIPVEPGDPAADTGKQTTFSANTSRLNFDVRTPAGKSQMRCFIEGDFYGGENKTSFRLRHAFAQFGSLLVGQTWSTFSDPAANHQDLDFEGINGENLVRQVQFRYTWQVQDDLSVAAAVETPAVSLTGGDGVDFMPDLVGRAIWSFKEIGHLQGAVALRQIRGESDTNPDDVTSVPGWGASISGVVPFYYFDLTDRFIFQFNFGHGNARYINDLQSLGGQDGVFDPVTGDLHALPTVGFYFDYEHQWKKWATTREMKLRTSLIWSFVTVDNFDFQPDDSYRTTNRYSINFVFSPTDHIDAGVEYIYGTRENKDGHQASADQVQFVGIFRF